MSISFSKNFINFTDEVSDTLNQGKSEDQGSRVSPSPQSTSSMLPGKVLFFTYSSEKFGDSEHLALVVRCRRGKYGTFTQITKTGKNKGRAKVYLSAVKLNNIWSQTASLIISIYSKSLRDNIQNTVYTKAKHDRFKSGMMALVGRSNFRTYIVNNMNNTFEVNNEEPSVEGDSK